MRSQYSATVLLLAAAGLAAQSHTWPIDHAPSELKPLIAKADVMVIAMQDALLRELAAALDSGGPDAAMASCHIDSRLVTTRLRREGVRAGRTSDRLRNPANAAPAWATDIVGTHAGLKAREVAGFVVDLGDKVGVLRPIAESPICAGCHGPADRLPPGVRDALARRYPSDKAVGFEPGELRGWFWLEIPKPRSTPGL